MNKLLKLKIKIFLLTVFTIIHGLSMRNLNLFPSNKCQTNNKYNKEKCLNVKKVDCVASNLYLAGTGLHSSSSLCSS